MSDPQTEASFLEDYNGFFKIYSDGSIVRGQEPPLPFSPLHHDYTNVLYKDIVFDHNFGLWARIYLPPRTQTQRVPLILFFHGGGFCIFSPATPAYHQACLVWASTLGAIIVSVDYRLAPEHRLPSAYEDSIAALWWLRSQSQGEAQGKVDPWFDSHADFSRVFLAGDSAGGNIAHHVGIWAVATESQSEMESLRVRGMILLYPYFGGEERTASEIRGGERVFNLEQSDAMWRFALPPGSDRDHPFCNPLSPRSHDVGSLVFLPMLFVVAGRDILRDRLLKYCGALEKCGKHDIQVLVYEEEDHGFPFVKMEEQNAVNMFQSISTFMKEKS